ncbi:DMT family transporter [Campylobacter majalis]|uniref:DMT family transporter n=1 Tax=Campylobacter majalis TaxID=2790656 RepID=UPI003D68D922
MKYLIIVTIVWAFSFSLIGEFLAGRIDSYFAVFVRVALASLVFLPFTKFRNIRFDLQISLMAIGAVQIGIMYLFYYNSFLYLSVAEIALFTIFTPFYVTFVYDICLKRFRALYLISVGIAVFGAFVIRYNDISNDFVIGFLLVQGANLCFGLGQSAYKVLIEKHDLKNQSEVFGYFHFGAFFVTIFAFLTFGDFAKISVDFTQGLILLWLGVVASGIGYFMWNKGGVSVDSGVLAIMNNALIPVAIIVNLIIWQKDIEFIKLFLGSIFIILSLIIHVKIMRFYNKQ